MEKIDCFKKANDFYNDFGTHIIYGGFTKRELKLTWVEISCDLEDSSFEEMHQIGVDLLRKNILI